MIVDAQVCLGCFDVELIAGTGEMQGAGFGQWALALAEQVNDALTAVGGHLVRVAEGFGDLLMGVGANESEDFS